MAAKLARMKALKQDVAATTVDLYTGLYPTATLEKQRPNMIGNLI
jgi:hypothetical protein